MSTWLRRVKVWCLLCEVITEELLNFARSKPAGEAVDESKRKNLQGLIDKLNEFRYILHEIQQKLQGTERQFPVDLQVTEYHSDSIAAVFLLEFIRS